MPDSRLIIPQLLFDALGKLINYLLRLVKRGALWLYGLLK